MKHTINAKLFFFNSDTDYLPYYKNYSATIDDEQTLADLLQAYAQQIRDYTLYPIVSVNGKIVHDTIVIKSLIENFGLDLEINPISGYRATKDLEINNDDFLKKYEILETFCDASDKAYYNTLEDIYYASSSLSYNDNYIGDAVLLLAHRIIAKKTEDKDAILKAVHDPENGIACYEYEDNIIPHKDIDQPIQELKAMINEKEKSCVVSEFINKIKSKIIKPEVVQRPTLRSLNSVNLSNETLVNSFQGFNLAFYTTQAYKELLDFSEANEVSFDTRNKASGVAMGQGAAETAHLKAATIITDAFDSSADILIVDNEAQRAHLDSAKTRKASKREIDLQIITLSQFLEIALGNKDKKALGLDKAKISFI